MDKVSHECHFAAGECGVAVEDLEEFIGEGGVVANDDVIGGLHSSGAEPMTVRQAVQRVSGQSDEVGVAVNINEDGEDAGGAPHRGDRGGAPHRGDRGDIAVADRRRADEPPRQRVVVGFDVGVDAVLVGPKQPRGSDPREQEQYQDEADLAEHDGAIFTDVLQEGCGEGMQATVSAGRAGYFLGTQASLSVIVRLKMRRPAALSFESSAK